jgi:GNAT superfamily N-acetyltransferase
MNNSSVRIKRVESVDKDFVRALNLVLAKDKQWNVGQGNKFLGDDNCALFVAYLEQKLVGFAIAYKLQRFDQKGAEILLDELEVVERFRRTGIGRKILESVREWAREVEAREIWIPTNKSNQAAVALYKSIGGRAENEDDIIFVVGLPD